MRRRVIFPNKVLPYVLLAPQLVITVIFFYWPAIQAIYYSVLLQDPFGLRTQFVWLENFQTILSDALYLGSVQVTVVFSSAVAALSMGVALLFAVMADRKIREQSVPDLAHVALRGGARRGREILGCSSSIPRSGSWAAG